MSFSSKIWRSIDVAAGQSISAGDVVAFTLIYQNQVFEILYGDFGRDTVEIGNQTINVDFFADLEGVDAIQFQDPQQVKLASKKELRLSPLTRHFLSQLNSTEFLEYLETLTGIQGLIPE